MPGKGKRRVRGGNGKRRVNGRKEVRTYME